MRSSQCLPQQDRCIRAKRPPPLGTLAQIVDTQRNRSLAEPEVRIRKRIGVAEGAHGDVVCGPGTDSAQCGEPVNRLVERSAAREKCGVAGHRTGHAANGVRARARHARHIGLRELLRRENARQSIHDCRRRADADLLPDDCAHRDLERLPRAGDARSRTSRDEWAEFSVFAEVRIDCDWVGVEVEQVPRSRGEVAGRGSPVSGADRQQECFVTLLDGDGSSVVFAVRE